MPRPKRRRQQYTNRLGLPALTAVLVVAASVSMVAIGLVLSRNRVHALAEQQRQVEQQISLLDQEIRQLNKRIDTQLTRDLVIPRLAAAGTRLQLIDEESLIQIPKLPTAPVATAVPVPPAAPSLAQNAP